MLFTTDQVTALAAARNTAQPLGEALAGKAPTDTATATTPATVATTVEALAAVVPTGVVGLYTLIVLPIQQYAENAATSANAAVAARLAKDPANSQAEIDAAVADLAQESSDLLRLRWGVIILTSMVVVALLTQAARAGNSAGHARKVPVAESLTALLAFLGWALATPGTPLATQFAGDEMVIVSSTAVGVAALLLLGLGKGVLTKPAGRAK